MENTELNKIINEYVQNRETADLSKLTYKERLELAEKFPHLFFNKEIRQRQAFNNCGNYSKGINF